jgi:ATP-dependent Clp protease adaptor protein ClpS
MNAFISAIDLMPVLEPGTREYVRTAEQDDTRLGGPSLVILYNCDCHTFEDVIVQLQKATGCTLEKAEALALEIHTQGKAIVYAGEPEKCEAVAGILRQIRLQVETDRV